MLSFFVPNSDQRNVSFEPLQALWLSSLDVRGVVRLLAHCGMQGEAR
jgi:hypothetical protein